MREDRLMRGQHITDKYMPKSSYSYLVSSESYRDQGIGQRFGNKK